MHRRRIKKVLEIQGIDDSPATRRRAFRRAGRWISGIVLAATWQTGMAMAHDASASEPEDTELEREETPRASRRLHERREDMKLRAETDRGVREYYSTKSE